MTHRDRKFQVQPFINPSGETVFRVSGWKGNQRIRVNYRSEEAARARRNELENEWLGGSGAAPVVRAVGFPLEFQKACESAFAINPDPRALLDAVRYWASESRRHLVVAANAPKLDEAVRQFLEWVESPASGLRQATVYSYRHRVGAFASKIGNVNLGDITSDHVLLYVTKASQNPRGQKTTRQTIARFFSWCAQRPRRWINGNPAEARGIPLRRTEHKTPEILSRLQILRVLAAARRYEGGAFLAFVTRQLFCGMRPTEAARMDLGGLSHQNKELRLEPAHTKTRRGRTVHLDPVALAWFKECEKVKVPAILTSNHKLWRGFILKARIPVWVHDVLRHTAITYKFRATGSYGLTAEWAGNSEAIIKRHYQGRGVTTSDATMYWGLFPSRDERRRRKVAERRRKTAKPSNVTQFPNAASPGH